jgi:hypothetical protein
VSQLLIQQYLNELRRLEQVSGSQWESVVREAFKTDSDFNRARLILVGSVVRVKRR